jgi:hypothetical protein
MFFFAQSFALCKHLEIVYSKFNDFFEFIFSKNSKFFLFKEKLDFYIQFK